VQRGTVIGAKRERLIRELDGLVAGACVLCGDAAVRMVDEPFVTGADDQGEWAL